MEVELLGKRQSLRSIFLRPDCECAAVGVNAPAECVMSLCRIGCVGDKRSCCRCRRKAVA